jgi:4-amino-4-deoxy-L-arabinose transferase-like glycosyltransferase
MATVRMSHPILPSGVADAWTDAWTGPRRTLYATLAFVALLTIFRIVLIFVSPLELYPDEAQYWVWSRRLAFGYFSKPPLIAWLIHLSTAIGGQGEAWVRLPAPIMHGLAALGLAGAGRTLYGGWSGFWSAVIYSAMPGVQLSSAVIATDAPLMACMSFALWGYAQIWTRPRASTATGAAVGLGLALGLAFLAKYAALYMVVGMATHAALSLRARRMWSPVLLSITTVAALVVAAPNIAWNAAHHFQTLAHTAANADIGGDPDGGGGGGLHLLDPRGPLGFIVGQFGVFGPVSFAVLMWSVVQAPRTGRAEDRMLVWLGLPALVVVFAESILARANANWAVAAYAPGAVLVAGVLVERRAWRVLGWGIGLQAFAAAVFVFAILAPSLTDAVGAGNAFKRARGWRQTADDVVRMTRAAQVGGPVSAVGVDDRFMFNALSYYARDAAGSPGAQFGAPLRMWVRLSYPANQAEVETPIDVAHGARVLLASVDQKHRPALIADFGAVTNLGTRSVRLDPKHQRDVVFLLGARFNPRSRVSGPAIRP